MKIYNGKPMGSLCYADYFVLTEYENENEMIISNQVEDLKPLCMELIRSGESDEYRIQHFSRGRLIETCLLTDYFNG